ncbi:MAG: TlpA family protein disulfide reductase, partial [Sphingomonadaceae bacterium]
KNASAASAATDRRNFLRGLAGLALLAPGLKAQAADVFSRVDPVQVPNFALEDSDGKMWRSSELKGKVVVVNFWATWCPPCRREIPSLEVLYKKEAPKGVVVLGVNAGESWNKVAAFAADFKPPLTYPLLLDKTGSVLRDWQIKVLPTTYVLGRDGRLALRAIGGRDFTQPDALQDLAALAQSK